MWSTLKKLTKGYFLKKQKWKVFIFYFILTNLFFVYLRRKNLTLKKACWVVFQHWNSISLDCTCLFHSPFLYLQGFIRWSSHSSCTLQQCLLSHCHMRLQQPSTRTRRFLQKFLWYWSYTHVHTLLHQGKGNNVKTNKCSPFKLRALCTLVLHKLLIRSINYSISVYKGDFLLQQSKTATSKKSQLKIRKL